VRKLLDVKYESKIKEIDELLKKREETSIERLLDALNKNGKEKTESKKPIKSTSQISDIEHNTVKISDFSKVPRTYVDFSKILRLPARKKKELFHRENDLFEEVYGKFAENYAYLVEEHTQTLLKMEGYRKRDFMALSLFGASIGIFAMLLIPMFWI